MKTGIGLRGGTVPFIVFQTLGKHEEQNKPNIGGYKYSNITKHSVWDWFGVFDVKDTCLE